MRRSLAEEKCQRLDVFIIDYETFIDTNINFDMTRFSANIDSQNIQMNRLEFKPQHSQPKSLYVNESKINIAQRCSTILRLSVFRYMDVEISDKG